MTTPRPGRSGRAGLPRLVPGLGAAGALFLAVTGLLPPGEAGAQGTARVDTRFAGLQWTFARIR